MEILSYAKGNEGEYIAINKLWTSPYKLKLEHNNLIFILSKDSKELIYAIKSKNSYIKFQGTTLFALELILPLMIPEKNLQVESIQPFYEDIKTINNYLCFKTIVNFKNKIKEKPSSITVWATRKLNIEYSILNIINSVIEYPFSKIINIANQINGFPILIQGDIMFQNENYFVKYELLKFQQIEIKDKVFELPPDYKLIEYNFSYK